MNRPAILGAVRHILTFAGGYFVASGDISEPELFEVIAAVMTILGLGWSIYDKKGVSNEE